MISRNEYQGMTWIDICEPTREEIREITNDYNIDIAIAETLLNPSPRPSIAFKGDDIFMILHFPLLRQGKNKGRTDSRQEVDFLLTTNALITVHYDSVETIDKFAKELEVASILEKNKTDHSGFLMIGLLKKMYQSLMYELESIDDRFRLTEKKVFSGREQSAVQDISFLNRDLFTIAHTLRDHQMTLEEFKEITLPLFGKEFEKSIDSVIDSYNELDNLVDKQTGLVSILNETNNSLLSTKQNKTMQLFTVMAFINLPLSLLVGLFGMNTINNPVVGHPKDFWIIVLIGGCVALFLTTIFRLKRWI